MPSEMEPQLDELRRWMSQGCDERVLPHPATGDIRYHLNPLVSEGLHYRGSCTAGVLTPDVMEVALNAVARIREGDSAGWADEQRRGLEKLVSTQAAFDTWFAPSGTDLLYYPLLFARSLSSRPLLNLLSCPEELGSGSRQAVAGQFFSSRTANGGKSNPGEAVHPALRGEVIELPARSSDGRIQSRKEEIHRLLDAHPDHQAIVHLVFGSKSGIQDDLDVIRQRPNVLWTVDLCQFRADPDLIGHLLGQGALVLITGSKFYHAPPFCGALLTPSGMLGPSMETMPELFESLGSILAKSDVPPSFPAIRAALPLEENPGSRLRWACALHEMESINTHSRSTIDDAIRHWNREFVRLMQRHPEFELIPDQSLTNDSIISFRVSVDGVYLNQAALKEIHRILCTTEWGAETPFRRVFIGQPVTYGERSFLRVAIGSRDVRRRIEGERSQAADARLLELLAETSRSWVAS